MSWVFGRGVGKSNEFLLWLCFPQNPLISLLWEPSGDSICLKDLTVRYAHGVVPLIIGYDDSQYNLFNISPILFDSQPPEGSYCNGHSRQRSHLRREISSSYTYWVVDIKPSCSHVTVLPQREVLKTISFNCCWERGRMLQTYNCEQDSKAILLGTSWTPR